MLLLGPDALAPEDAVTGADTVGGVCLAWTSSIGAKPILLSPPSDGAPAEVGPGDMVPDGGKREPSENDGVAGGGDGGEGAGPSSGNKSMPASVSIDGTVMAPWQCGQRPRWPPYCSFIRNVFPQPGQLKTIIMTAPQRG
jgi:hypothetical protein